MTYVDHTWHRPLEVHCHLGMPGDVRCFDVVGPDALAVAITAQLHSLARRHRVGQKITLSPKWVKRIHESAENIQEQADQLE